MAGIAALCNRKSICVQVPPACYSNETDRAAFEGTRTFIACAEAEIFWACKWLGFRVFHATQCRFIPRAL